MKILQFLFLLTYSQLGWAANQSQPTSFIGQYSITGTSEAKTSVVASVVAPQLQVSRISPEAFSYKNESSQGNSYGEKPKPKNAFQSSIAQPQVSENNLVQAVRAKNYISAKAIKRSSKGSRVRLRSHVALIYDERDKEYIFTRHSNRVMSIASLTKLMMAMVILDAKLSMNTVIKISKADKDRIRYSKSRLSFGSKFSRGDLLLMALLASENRAAAALARNYPGGKKDFVAAMNKKARKLGLKKTHFYDPAGLHDKNVSTARELNQLAQAAMDYPLIKLYTTMKNRVITNLRTGRHMKFNNTNRLVKKDSWAMRLSKTGFTNTAGNCLIMKTSINNRPVTMVLLNSWGKLSKYGDSNRLKKWLIKTERRIRKKQLAQGHDIERELASISSKN